MQSHDDVFARRLERLAKNDTQGATRHSAPPAIPVTPSEKSRKIPPWGLVLASAFLVVSGGAFAALALLPSAATPPCCLRRNTIGISNRPTKTVETRPDQGANGNTKRKRRKHRVQKGARRCDCR